MAASAWRGRAFPRTGAGDPRTVRDTARARAGQAQGNSGHRGRRPDGDSKYYRDADGVHHVPKRALSELVLHEYVG